jgi:hypothetical protein
VRPKRARESRHALGWLLASLGVLLALAAAAAYGVALAAFAANALESFAQSIGAGLKQGLEQSIAEGVQQALEPMAAVFDFEGNLQVGNIEAAYALTTAEYQRRQSLEEFAEFVDRHPELRSRWATLAHEARAEDSCLYRLTAETDDGLRSVFELRLKRGTSGWRVDDIVLP